MTTVVLMHSVLDWQAIGISAVEAKEGKQNPRTNVPRHSSMDPIVWVAKVRAEFTRHAF